MSDYVLPEDADTRLVEDEALKAAIVEALFEHWPEYGYSYTLKLLED